MVLTSGNFIFNSANFCVIVGFFTKLLTLGILFSTAFKTVIVDNLVILGILVVAELVILGISPLSYISI